MRASPLPFSIVEIVFGICVAFWAESFAMDIFPLFLEKDIKISENVSFPSNIDKSIKEFGESMKVLPCFFDKKITGYTLNLFLKIITVFSGISFLLVLLCMLWWFERYINRVEPPTNIYHYLLDYTVVGMFALASFQWYKPHWFLIASTCAVIPFLFRLYLLYWNSTDIDRHVLKEARNFLISSYIVAIVVYGCYFLLSPQGSYSYVKIVVTATIPGVFCLIGTLLTFILRRKLLFIAEFHESEGRHNIPMELCWPSELKDKNKATIRKGTNEGKKMFNKLFVETHNKNEKSQIPKSRVHAESDLWVQSYILSLPSVPSVEVGKEIKHKVFMVIVSHWLDDMLDGRKEAELFSKIDSGKIFGNFTKAERKKYKDLSLEEKVKKFLNVQDSEAIFKKTFKGLVDKYVSGMIIDKPIKNNFFDKLLPKIRESALEQKKNEEFIFLGFNRVALGSIISGPRISEEDRKKVIKGHNEKLFDLLVEQCECSNTEWLEKVKDFIQEMLNDEDGVGQTLLALTTKTTQEIAMSSEENEINFPLSLLFSILYAPLLYFHDYKEETESGEIVPLDTFHDYELIKYRLDKARKLCEDTLIVNKRWNYQKQQLEMAFKCFENRLPESLRKILRSAYIPDKKRQTPSP